MRFDIEVTVVDRGDHYEATAASRAGVGAIRRRDEHPAVAAQQAFTALATNLIDLLGVTVECAECDRPREHSVTGKPRQHRGYCLGVHTCLVRS